MLLKWRAGCWLWLGEGTGKKTDEKRRDAYAPPGDAPTAGEGGSRFQRAADTWTFRIGQGYGAFGGSPIVSEGGEENGEGGTAQRDIDWWKRDDVSEAGASTAVSREA